MSDTIDLRARIERVEEDHRDLRQDIRKLTDAVAALGSSVAVLAEKVAQLVSYKAEVTRLESRIERLEGAPANDGSGSLVSHGISAAVGGVAASMIEIAKTLHELFGR